MASVVYTALILFGQDHTNSRAGLGDGPMAGLRCPMQLLSGLVLVQVDVRNLLVTHLCRLDVEPLVVV